MKTFTEKLRQYAELALKIGVNLQPEQELVISASVEAYDFVRLLTEKAYALGAGVVHVDWSDGPITRMKLTHVSEDTLAKGAWTSWRIKEMNEIVTRDAAFLRVGSPDPELLKGVDVKRLGIYNKSTAKMAKPYRDLRSARNNSWSIVCLPTQAWADKVFPDVPAETRITRLWESIFTAVRIDQPDPIAAWQMHVNNIKRRLQLLNDKQYQQLQFKAPGTDLTIELNPNHIWVGGGIKGNHDNYYVPNIPTEEIFTAPKRTAVNGVVRSTKPLIYQGNRIENFTLTFEAGKVKKVVAETGQTLLETILNMDDGASYLGEVALVPHQSPISQTGLVFWNTLFDENASCHLALGSAYKMCQPNGVTMNDEELRAHGLNTSIIHVDFMIGSSNMQIIGVLPDGREEQIFLNGNWVY